MAAGIVTEGDGAPRSGRFGEVRRRPNGGDGVGRLLNGDAVAKELLAEVGDAEIGKPL